MKFRIGAVPLTPTRVTSLQAFLLAQVTGKGSIGRNEFLASTLTADLGITFKGVIAEVLAVITEVLIS